MLTIGNLLCFLKCSMLLSQENFVVGIDYSGDGFVGWEVVVEIWRIAIFKKAR